MRPTATTQSSLRAPLNKILGTEAKIRILRVITLTQVPMSKAAIAHRANLNASGVSRTIEELIDQGIVQSLGIGSRRLFTLHQDNRLAASLEDLFTTEITSFDSLLDDLRSTISLLKPPPSAAWIQGSLATRTDTAGEPIAIGLLASAKNLDKLIDQLREYVAEVEQRHDITISVQGLTSADYHTLPKIKQEVLLETLPLLGPPPLDLLVNKANKQSNKKFNTHATHDDWAFIVARAIADKLTEDPTYIETAQKYIAHRLKHSSARGEKELLEWKRILHTMSIPRLKKFLVDNSERAKQLRQSLPFIDVLTSEELDNLKEQQHD